MKIIKDDNAILCSNKQLDIVNNLLQGGRRYFGSSGASLTHQIHRTDSEALGLDPELAKAGLEGEHRTSRMILEWMKDKPNAVLVDSVHLKSYGEETLNVETGTMDGGDTDHVLIIDNFVLIIDSKNWKGRRKYSINDSGEVIRGKTTFPGGKITTLRASRLWAEALKHHNVVISSIVNISSDKVFVVRDRNWWKQPYRLVTLETLRTQINANLVASVASNALKPYDVFKERLGEVSELLEIE